MIKFDPDLMEKAISNMAFEQFKKHTIHGIYHCTDFSNFINIMQEGFLLSRSEMKKTKHVFYDSAFQEVINHGGTLVQDYVRFYWRPKTPTNYLNEGIQEKPNGYQMPRPVYLVFDSSVYNHPGVKFTNINASSNYLEIADNIKDLNNIQWDLVFYDSKRGAPYPKTKQSMCAEILYPKKIKTKYIKEIIFRCNADKKQAIDLLGHSRLFKVDSSYFFNHNYTSHGYTNYVSDYKIKKYPSSYVSKYGYTYSDKSCLEIKFSHLHSLENFKHELHIIFPDKTVSRILSSFDKENGAIIRLPLSDLKLNANYKDDCYIEYYMNDNLCFKVKV